MTNTLTVQPKNIQTLVRREVVGVMREVLSDPDAGLELTPAFIRRLKISVKNAKSGKATPLSKILRQYRV